MSGYPGDEHYSYAAERQAEGRMNREVPNVTLRVICDKCGGAKCEACGFRGWNLVCSKPQESDLTVTGRFPTQPDYQWPSRVEGPPRPCPAAVIQEHNARDMELRVFRHFWLEKEERLRLERLRDYGGCAD